MAASLKELEYRYAAKQLRPAAKALVLTEPRSLWETDTAQLPKPLRKYRRKVREFSNLWLRPWAAAADVDPEAFDERPVLVAAARAGYLSDVAPRPYGSAPLRFMRFPYLMPSVLKIEEFCAACGGFGVMLGAHHLGIAPVLISFDRAAWRRWLRPVLKSNRQGKPLLYAFAITEPGAGSDAEDAPGAALAKPGVRAIKDGRGWRLSGAKCFISGGDLAQYVTVFAAIEDEGIESWTCFVVDKGCEGFSVGRHEKKMGQRSSSAVELQFDDVFVDATRIVGGLRKGWALNRATLNLSRGPVGAIALGIARGALDTTIKYVNETKLGGKALINYQEVQLPLAQMILDVTAMRAMVWHTARFYKPNGGVAAAAKVFCGELGYKVCETAMSVLTDTGALHTAGIEKRLRDIRLNQIYEGTNDINRLSIIEEFALGEFPELEDE